MENEPDKKQASLDSANVESLDSQTTVVTEDTTAGAGGAQPTGAPAGDDKKPKKEKKKNSFRPKGIVGKLNIYLLLFILVIVIAGIVTYISYQQNKKNNELTSDISTTPLSEEDLAKLRQTDVKVGDPKQVLSVESNAIFAGKVLIRDSLEVAGQIKVGGPLNLPGISVSGTSVFDQVTISNLQISGSATVEGQLNVQSGINVTGNLNVGGQISAAKLNIETLAVNQDLQLARHIDAGGGTPGISKGSAVGGGGTVSLSGTDTAGTININTGGGTVAGCFASVSFTRTFSSAHVAIAPIGSAAAGLNYYLNRSNSGFSICTTNAATAGTSFAFDYVVID